MLAPDNASRIAGALRLGEQGSAGRAKSLSYVLVTPARNEAKFIERTLRSVVEQTRRPMRWIVVSDGSTDGTDEIVQRYADRHAWIELLRLDRPDGRDFARKARAFNAGSERLRRVAYDIIGNLDADLSFDDEYLAFLVDRFGEMPALGVAGTPFLEGGAYYDYQFTSIAHVSGGCQLFRKECFAELGGYVPIERGGIDWIAVTTARMNGWQTRTFVEKVCVHHRQMGRAGSTWRIWFRRGEQDYRLGGHPLWQVARSVYQAKSRPYGVRGLMLLSGYAYASIKRTQRPISNALLRFHRAEQLARLKRVALRSTDLRRGGTSTDESRELSLGESLSRLELWVEAHDYRGYEPFDGLSSPYLRRFTLGNQLLERLVQQVGRQSPVNVRPLLGIKPLESTKGRGYMAWGYLALLALSGKEKYRDKAIASLEWLMRHKSQRSPHYGWGNHFDYASRAGQFAKHEPLVVWTSLIGQAFLDGYEQLGDERYLEVAESICEWILTLPRERSATGSCLSYVGTGQISIHNANLLGAAMLARSARHCANEQFVDVARLAMQYSCARQQPDGAWYYGEDAIYRWIDGFHTAYNLDSIKCYVDSTGDDAFRPHLERGFRYFKATFCESDGRPRYYHDRAYPIDIQCAAQAIETLAKFSGYDSEALPAAMRVARWTIRNMQDPSGYFYYRRYPFMVARIPMLHWGQATMFRALAFLSVQSQPAAASPA
jgi:glycosyltransferase involved in cell wall biosynthesis